MRGEVRAGRRAGGRLEGVVAQGLAMCGTRQGTERTRLETGGRAWAVHTSNIWLMSMTPEVSQPETSALNSPKSLKSSLMLVIAETSQPEMGPYVAMAEAALVLNAWAADRREAVSVKA